MPLTAWPPVGITWPPPGYFILQAETVEVAKRVIVELGWSWRNPTVQENQDWFNDVRCERGHRVDGVVVVDVRDGGLYPFAVCRGVEAEQLVLWPPYSQGHTD